MDTDGFVDEGNVAAGMPVDVEVPEESPVEGAPVAETTAEQPQPEQPQPEETPVKETPAEQPAQEEPQESFLLQETEDEQPEAEETTVPVHVVADLRAKNRDLKQQLADQANTRPAAENAEVGPDPLAELEDDDFLTAGQIRDARKHDQRVADQQKQAEQQQQAETTAKADQRAFAQASEQATIKEFPDYLATMRAVEDYLPRAEIQAAMQTKNPCKLLYAKAKQLTATLGIEVQTPTTATEPENKNKPQAELEPEEVQTDDEVFDELFEPTAA